MKIIYEYSHFGGKEILQRNHREILKEINQVIKSITNVKKLKISAEKTMKGRALFDPKDLNKRFKEAFTTRGFNELKEKYDIQLPGCKKVIRGAFKQVDFVKDNVLVEVQFGKYFAMFYDMTKFQYFFNQHMAKVGIEIVPCHSLKKQMSSGVAYGEQLIFDLERLNRIFPTVPIYIILIDV